jgi:hypothetical protein
VRKRISVFLCAMVALGVFPARSFADVNVERGGVENPVVEVFRSTVYGALAGVAVGGAIALAVGSDADEILRWSIVGGTAIGLGAGVYFVSRRPQPSALLELKDGGLSLHPPVPQLEPGGGVSMQLVAVRY